MPSTYGLRASLCEIELREDRQRPLDAGTHMYVAVDVVERGSVGCPSAFASLANLTDSAGGLVLPSLHNENPTLYSRPVYVSPELPAATVNARSLVVGDFSVGYAVRRVTGLGLHRQTELHSDSGQIGYRLFARVDGRVVLPDALRILTNSAT